MKLPEVGEIWVSKEYNIYPNVKVVSVEDSLVTYSILTNHFRLTVMILERYIVNFLNAYKLDEKETANEVIREIIE